MLFKKQRRKILTNFSRNKRESENFKNPKELETFQKFQRIRDLNNNFKAENYKAVRVISREVSQIKKMRFAHF